MLEIHLRITHLIYPRPIIFTGHIPLAPDLDESIGGILVDGSLSRTEYRTLVCLVGQVMCKRPLSIAIKNIFAKYAFVP